ncbi:Synaptosomal-associated protein 25-A [Thelohanellus kitauei]|uniref:Synaptosomal-associated protein 25-A n=1 Tax=Thelohanellus kitauei TaxID=669202 RepID=A0A0C2NEU0_THEKT|nr:Synaptosomal-associated protein 25-A [Thelohanellus kitauei]
MGDYDKQIDEHLDHNLDASRRIRNLAENTQEMAVKGAETLQSQGEQLRKARDQQRELKTELKEAEKELSFLDRCCFCLLCGSDPKKKESKSESQTEATHQDLKVCAPERTVQTSGNIKRVTEDAREVEIDENVGFIQMYAENLKDIAHGLNKELDSQNELIETMAEENLGAQASLNRAKDKTDKILNK